MVSKLPFWSVAAGALLALGGSVAGFYYLTHRPQDPAEGSAAAHWQIAQAALADGDLDRSQEHLSRCLEFWPLHAETHFLLARNYRRLDDAHGWQAHLKYAEQLRWPAADIIFENQLMTAQAGDVSGADRVVIDQIESRPGDEPLILEAILKGYLETHQWRELFSWADHWMHRRPLDWQPYFFRGRAYQLLWVLDRAIADHRKVLELRPEHRQSHFHLGESLMIDGQYPEAIPEFEKYLETHPDHAGALVGLANCQLSLSVADLERAAKTLERLVARHPKNAGGLFLRAKLALNRGQAQEALDWLKQAEAVSPGELDLTNLIAAALRQLGRGQEAEKYERQLAQLQQWVNEFEDVRRDVRKRPDDPELRHRAGVLSLNLAREEDAARWFKSALRIDPHHRPTHLTLADHYDKTGNVQRAEYHRKMAAESPPPTPDKAKSSE